jgi:hypothetical protein
LLQDPDYRDLTPAERGLLHGIWLAYAQADGELRTGSLHDACSMRTGTLQLFSLNQAGFIEFSASKPLAQRQRQRQKPPNPLVDNSGKELLRRALDLAADWQGGTSESFDEQLDALERDLHAQLPLGQRYRLWDEALKRQKRSNI